MKIALKAIVTEMYTSDRGKTYVSMVDMGNGGQVKIIIDGVPDIKPGQIVTIDSEVRGRLDRSGGTYLVFQSGTIQRA